MDESSETEGFRVTLVLKKCLNPDNFWGETLEPTAIFAHWTDNMRCTTSHLAQNKSQLLTKNEWSGSKRIENIHFANHRHRLTQSSTSTWQIRACLLAAALDIGKPQHFTEHHFELLCDWAIVSRKTLAQSFLSWSTHLSNNFKELSRN